MTRVVLKVYLIMPPKVSHILRLSAKPTEHVLDSELAQNSVF
jgi:hypothetical protein